jgi:hypothetical protein
VVVTREDDMLDNGRNLAAVAAVAAVAAAATFLIALYTSMNSLNAFRSSTCSGVVGSPVSIALFCGALIAIVISSHLE